MVTIVASIDGNSIKAFYSEDDPLDVVEQIDSGKMIFCDGEMGAVHLNPSTVLYVQSGRRSLPVSASPSATSLSEHASHVSGVHQ